MRGRHAASAFLVLLGLMASGCSKPAASPKPPPPPEVLFALPTMQEVTDYEDFTGRAEAVKTVEVRARVTGYLERFLFEEGREVKENDVLFEIDARPYKATLDQAVAEVAQAQAMLSKADADFQRAHSTFTRQAISRSEYDIATAALAEARASVGIAEAKRDMAKLNYEWTKVTAPITGQVSRRMVDPGNLVQADVTPLTTIVAVDKMYINFDIDERTLLKIRRLIRDGKVQTRDQKQLNVYAALVDEDINNFPHRGVVDFSDNRVDPGSATLRLRGVFENQAINDGASSRFLRRIMSPGLFVRVRLPIGDPHQAVLVPEESLGSDQGKKYVFLLNAKDEVVRSEVEVDKLHGRLREIKSGVKAGDRVIVGGMQRVRAMQKVRPTPYEQFMKQNRSAVAKDKGPAKDASRAKSTTETAPAPASGAAPPPSSPGGKP